MLESVGGNTVLNQDTTLYCLGENNIPVNWSYVNLTGDTSTLNTSTNVITGFSVLSITTDSPGYYSCQISRSDGVTETRTTGLLITTNYTCKLRLNFIQQIKEFVFASIENQANETSGTFY